MICFLGNGYIMYDLSNGTCYTSYTHFHELCDLFNS